MFATRETTQMIRKTYPFLFFSTNKKFFCEKWEPWLCYMSPQSLLWPILIPSIFVPQLQEFRNLPPSFPHQCLNGVDQKLHGKDVDKTKVPPLVFCYCLKQKGSVFEKEMTLLPLNIHHSLLSTNCALLPVTKNQPGESVDRRKSTFTSIFFLKKSKRVFVLRNGSHWRVTCHPCCLQPTLIPSTLGPDYKNSGILFHRSHTSSWMQSNKNSMGKQWTKPWYHRLCIRLLPQT